MSYRRENRGSRTSLTDRYDGIEEGGIRASPSYSSDVIERENDKDLDSLKDRVTFLKQLSGDIHNEVLTHNRFLDRMGNDMDASRGILSGTVDRFKMVFEKKSRRSMCKLVGFLVLFCICFFYLFRILKHFM